MNRSDLQSPVIKPLSIPITSSRYRSPPPSPKIINIQQSVDLFNECLYVENEKVNNLCKLDENNISYIETLKNLKEGESTRKDNQYLNKLGLVIFGLKKAIKIGKPNNIQDLISQYIQYDFINHTIRAVAEYEKKEAYLYSDSAIAVGLYQAIKNIKESNVYKELKDDEEQLRYTLNRNEEIILKVRMQITTLQNYKIKNTPLFRSPINDDNVKEMNKQIQIQRTYLEDLKEKIEYYEDKLLTFSLSE
jgi:hypothetical protein